MKKRWIILLLVAVLTAWVLWANTAIEVNEWTVKSPEIPASFDGLRIAQLSDLHNTEFGASNERLLALLREAEPDIIVLTGDLIDSRNTKVDIALEFVRQAVQIAPCYFVSGNHESRVPEWTALRRGLLDAGATILDGDSVPLERDGAQIILAGVSSPAFGGDFVRDLEKATAGEGYTILLSHHPEWMAQYVARGVDLVFSGHAHGGQVRIPFVGGLIAPNQGFFPKYDAGAFREGETVMLVSRGLGNSIIPLRVNNRPEIIVAVLQRAS